MRSTLGILGATALLATLSSVPLRAGNIVINPGFETGDLTGWNFTPAPSGSDFHVANLFPPNSGAFGADFGGVTSGSYDMISQTLSTTVGTTYTFSFWLGANDSADDGQQVFWNGNSILNLVNFAQPNTFYSFTETATTSSTTIAFAGYNTPSWNGVDDVSVMASTAAPEPSSLILFGAGSAIMVALRRRRCRA